MGALCTKPGPAITPCLSPLAMGAAPPGGGQNWMEPLAGRRPRPRAWLGRRVLTHVKMEKKEKAMAARAASVPSLSGLSLGLETCHWLAR